MIQCSLRRQKACIARLLFTPWDYYIIYSFICKVYNSKKFEKICYAEAESVFYLYIYFLQWKFPVCDVSDMSFSKWIHRQSPHEWDRHVNSSWSPALRRSTITLSSTPEQYRSVISLYFFECVFFMILYPFFILCRICFRHFYYVLP